MFGRILGRGGGGGLGFRVFWTIGFIRLFGLIQGSCLQLSAYYKISQFPGL